MTFVPADREHAAYQASSNGLPSGLVIGLARCGTSFLQECMRRDPAVYVPGVKDAYFFDREYHKGADWYRSLFTKSEGRPSIEICHDYFFQPATAGRIHNVLGSNVRLTVILREPSSWVISVARRELSIGMHGGSTLERVLARSAGLIALGNYVPFIRHWRREFGDDALSVSFYDDLLDDGPAFYRRIAEGLGFQPELEDFPGVVNGTREARSRRVAAAAKAAADGLRRSGMLPALGALKRSRTINQALFKSPTSLEQVSPDVIKSLKYFYGPSVEALSSELGVDLISRWYEQTEALNTSERGPDNR